VPIYEFYNKAPYLKLRSCMVSRLKTMTIEVRAIRIFEVSDFEATKT